MDCGPREFDLLLLHFRCSHNLLWHGKGWVVIFTGWCFRWRGAPGFSCYENRWSTLGVPRQDKIHVKTRRISCKRVFWGPVREWGVWVTYLHSIVAISLNDLILEWSLVVMCCICESVL